MSSVRQGKMVLFLFLTPLGYQATAWRDPNSRVEDLYGLDLPASVAQRAEEAKIHALFLADFLHFRETGPNPAMPGYEPMTTLAAIAARTSRIGLVATASTTFSEPYQLARQFSQLDWISGGRSGWNIVTSRDGGQNFRVDLPGPEERYRIAQEFMTAVTRIWNAWEPDAVLADRERGIWADLGKIRQVDHEGSYFRVKEPILLPRSPQGYPVFAQAGGSDAGRDFAASWAEVIYAVQASLGEAQTFYKDLKSRCEAKGRNRNMMKILPGLMPIIGSTEADAKRRHRELAEFMGTEGGIKNLSGYLHGADLSGLELDKPIPRDRLMDPQDALADGARSRYADLWRLAVEENLTLREMITLPLLSRGHGLVVGTVEQVADHMETWFREYGGDGFSILPPDGTESMARIFDSLIPELQDRGLFQEEYQAPTLRDSLQHPSLGV